MRRRTRPSSTDALDLLAQEHRAVEALFAGFERVSKKGTRGVRGLVARLVDELALHTAIEEQVLYPFARSAIPALRDRLLQSLEEHNLVKRILREIESLAPGDPHLAPKVRVLAENVRFHVTEEEDELFPRLRRVLTPDAREQLRFQLARAREAYSSKKRRAA
jgi:hemerythrin-like domain-containing protein